MSEGDTTSKEEIEDFSNDPLDAHENRTPTPKQKRGRGHPRKGEGKKQGQTKTKYNIRNRISVSEAVAMASTMSSSQFLVDDTRLNASGMSTFKSWADECDAENTPPMHGADQVVK